MFLAASDMLDFLFPFLVTFIILFALVYSHHIKRHAGWRKCWTSTQFVQGLWPFDIIFQVWHITQFTFLGNTEEFMLFYWTACLFKSYHRLIAFLYVVLPVLTRMKGLFDYTICIYQFYTIFLKLLTCLFISILFDVAFLQIAVCFIMFKSLNLCSLQSNRHIWCG